MIQPRGERAKAMLQSPSKRRRHTPRRTPREPPPETPEAIRRGSEENEAPNTPEGAVKPQELFPKAALIEEAPDTPGAVVERRPTSRSSGVKAKLEVEPSADKVDKKALEVDKKKEKVRQSYKVLRKATGALGGNADGGAIYGEITEGSMARIVTALEQYCGFSSRSTFIDVGSGLGKPNVHVAQYPGVVCSYGIELEDIRYKLAMINLDALLKQESLQRSVFFSKGDIAMAESFAGFTHVYMYDLGFPPETREHISKMWSDSGPHTKYLVSYIRPSVLIEQYDMEIEELVDEDGEPLRIPTSMHGSAEGHTAYFYKRSPPMTTDDEFPADASEIASMVDPVFKQGFELVGGPVEDLQAHTTAVVADYLTETRKTRSRTGRRKVRND